MPHLGAVHFLRIVQFIGLFLFGKKWVSRFRKYRRPQTTSMIERQNREFHKRMRKVSIFPNEGSAVRLLGAMRLELSEKWQGESKRNINKDPR